MNPRHRVRAAWVFFAVCIVGWPVSAIFFAQFIQQIILGLSWVSLIVAALVMVLTTDVREQQEDES